MARKGKKNIDVQLLVEFANRQLARTDVHADSSYKMATCNFVEKILLETGNYNGFMFINNDDSEFGTLGYFSRKYFLNGKI